MLLSAADDDGDLSRDLVDAGSVNAKAASSSPTLTGELKCSAFTHALQLS
jgi:hypothetical protein